MPPMIIEILATLAVGLVVGWLLGRFTGAAAARSRDLAARVETLRKESEHAAAELAAAKAQISQVRFEQEQYRTRVSDHFAGASEKFRDLSLQTRSLFDHLSEGARALCGDSFAALESDLVAGALPAQSSAAPTQPRGDADAADETGSPA